MHNKAGAKLIFFREREIKLYTMGFSSCMPCKASSKPHLVHERLKELDHMGMPHGPGVIDGLAAPGILGLVIYEDVRTSLD